MGPGRTSSEANLAAMTSDIVAAYVRANQVIPDDLPTLIETVFATLRGLSNGEAATLEDRAPAVPVKRSVTADFIICLEDGQEVQIAEAPPAHALQDDAGRISYSLEPAARLSHGRAKLR